MSDVTGKTMVEGSRVLSYAVVIDGSYHEASYELGKDEEMSVNVLYKLIYALNENVK